MHIGAFMTIKGKYLKGSITVEAAFTFTLTIFVLFLMLGPLLIIKTSSDFMIELNEMSKLRCNYEMIKYASKDTKIYKKIDEYLSENDSLGTNIDNVEDALNCSAILFDFSTKYDDSHSEYRNISFMYDMNTDTYDESTGIVKYDYLVLFSLPFNVLHVNGVNKRLVNMRRAFIGADGDRFDGEAEAGDMVYVANNVINSYVYHDDINCTYLIKRTNNFQYSNLSSHRNYNNKAYSKCDYCFKNKKLNANTICYVTQYGDRYHSYNTCPKMTAYVTQIPRENVDIYNLRPCFRCVKKEE